MWLPRAVSVEGTDTSPPNALNPNPVSITDNEIEKYILLADSDINSRLSGIYDVPLKRINIGGKVNYPDPIPLISARFTAMLIFQQRLSGAEKTDAEWVRENFNKAVNELSAIQAGHQRLLNTNSNRSSRFARSDWYPTLPYPSKFPPGENR
jgi:hypothetical protein